MADTVNTAPVAEQAPAAEPSVNSEQQVKADPQLEVWARKERQLRGRIKELEQRETALKAKETQYETGYVQKDRLVKDPFAVLNEAGLGYDKLTEMLLQSPNPNDPTYRAVMAKIASMEEAQQRIMKQSEEAQTKQHEQALNQIRNEVKLMVASDESYETVKSLGLEEAVVELVQETFDKDGYLMDISEAASKVEEHLVEEAYKMSQLKKIQARLAPKAEPVQTQPAKSQQISTQLKTLTNNMPTQPSSRSKEKERIARAMAAFKGQLK